MAVVYLDLDGFKEINDTLGHSTGDSLLKIVARRLESVVREEDTVARVGGDEFMIALWQVANASDVATVAAKLVEIVSQPYSIEDRRVTVTTSAGVGIYPDHGEDADSLMKSADDSSVRGQASRQERFSNRAAAHTFGSRARESITPEGDNELDLPRSRTESRPSSSSTGLSHSRRSV